MKKISFYLFAMVLIAGFMYSSGITVNSPVGGTWYKGSTYDIKWSLSGCSSSNPNVKINIFKDSIAQENFVVQLTALTSSGLKGWTIPNSYANGNYIIRVKTADSACFGDSGVFIVADKPAISTIMAVRRQASPLTRLRSRPMAAVMAVKPRIFVTHPRKWQYVTDNQSIQVRWKIAGIMLNRVKIAAVIRKYNQAEKVFPIATYVPNSGAYTWKTRPFLGHSQDSFQIRVTTMDGKVNGLSGNFYLSSWARVKRYRQDFLVLINQYRQANGKAALVLDGCLNKAAQGHSIYMHDSGNFSHTGKNGSDHQERCKQAGCICTGENIQVGASTAADVFRSWKASPGHNARMLSPHTYLGLGYANGYWTTVFR